MNALVYRLVNWYALRFPFPKRGLKFFVSFLRRANLLDKSYLKKSKDGILFKLNINDHIQRTIFWYGSYEEKQLKILEKLIRPDSVFFDIGANIGVYSLLASKLITGNGQVHSFEPSRSLMEQLKENIALNGNANICTNHLAVTEVAKEVKLFISSDDNLGMTGLRPASNFSERIEYVQGITIDEYTSKNEISKLDIVKLDIEGSEVMALHGMQNTLHKFEPVLLVEINNHNLMNYGLGTNDVYNFLESFGYKAYQITNGYKLTHVTSKQTEGAIIVFLPASFPADDLQ